jgi:Mg-chelatase subunit ChlD
VSGDLERERRWKLALGAAPEGACGPGGWGAWDGRADKALGALYDDPENRKGGLGASAPRVAQWMGDVRDLFPESVVAVVQKDAIERRGLRQLLFEPETLATLEADIHLVSDLVSLRGAIPPAAKAAARQVVAKLVAQLMERLAAKTVQTLRGARDRAHRTHRPRFQDIDWGKTIAANLSTWTPETGTVIPERLVGSARRVRREAELDRVTLCVDQSGSMAPSVIYASVFAAVLASIPSLRTRLVCFDTTVVDWTEQLKDPVEVLWGVQLGGGTDINRAVAYCRDKMEAPAREHCVLITDLYEGGDAGALVRRLERMVTEGVNVVVLLALSDQGRPSYDSRMAKKVADLGIPVFACTPDLFPEMMAHALQRQDVAAWAAERGIAVAS